MSIIDDINKVKVLKKTYEFQLNRVRNAKKDTQRINDTVQQAIENLRSNKNSFVIYGEPQSGKTEMMICLAAKLIDEGNKIVIILINDNLHLRDQNIDRFVRAHVTPIPVDYQEIISPTYKIDHETQMVIFCKKNSKDLQKLLDKIDKFKGKVIIDDEADYASPDGKINKVDEQTKINELVGNLLKKDGVYIGVTATPARLDLNNTFDNIAENWIDFKAHENYNGAQTFFPTDRDHEIGFNLKLLPPIDDNPKYLEDALSTFIASVGYLNTRNKDEIKNFCMLVHTSHKTDMHAIDYGIASKFIRSLTSQEDSKYELRWTKVKAAIEKKYPNDVEIIFSYVVNNISKNKVLKMNFIAKRDEGSDFDHGTNPIVPFTVCVGGNIASRGLTFNNLLSMFFARNAIKIQQDTYIQRARMFGSRNDYLKEFELTIPDTLYNDWHKCFMMHNFSLASIKSNKTVPTWLGSSRHTPAAKNSIDLGFVNHQKGEMGFKLFKFDSSVEKIMKSSQHNNYEKLKELQKVLGDDHVPSYILLFIEHNMPQQEKSISINGPTSIDTFNPKYTDISNIERPRGFIGGADIRRIKAENPDAIHHIWIYYSPIQQNKARLFYVYDGKYTVIRNLKHHKV